jgi:hypothetical protein
MVPKIRPFKSDISILDAKLLKLQPLTGNGRKKAANRAGCELNRLRECDLGGLECPGNNQDINKNYPSQKDE